MGWLDEAMPSPVPWNARVTEVRDLPSDRVVLSRSSAVLPPAPTPSVPPPTSRWAYTGARSRGYQPRPRGREGLPCWPTGLRCMPPHLRRRGSGLLQNPRPRLLPSPNYVRLGPLGPSRVVLSTQPSSCPLRPAATFLLASPPGSHPDAGEFTSGLLWRLARGGTHTRRSIGPLLGTPLQGTPRSEPSWVRWSAKGRRSRSPPDDLIGDP